jgi:hypothetical protein
MYVYTAMLSMEKKPFRKVTHKKPKTFDILDVFLITCCYYLKHRLSGDYTSSRLIKQNFKHTPLYRNIYMHRILTVKVI